MSFSLILSLLSLLLISTHCQSLITHITSNTNDNSNINGDYYEDNVDNLVWVVALTSQETQYQACIRVNSIINYRYNNTHNIGDIDEDNDVDVWPIALERTNININSNVNNIININSNSNVNSNDIDNNVGMYRFKWDDRTIDNVIKGLNCSVDNGNVDANKHGYVHGCCSPGLFMNITSNQCYTTHYSSSFSNTKQQLSSRNYVEDSSDGKGEDSNDNSKGNASDKDEMRQVFTCRKRAPLTKHNLSLVHANYHQGYVDLYGRGLYSSSKELQIDVMNQPCTHLESCTGICQSCHNGSPCPFGSICLNVGSHHARCYPYCAGKEDNSCPCGSSCVTMKVRSAYSNSDALVHLCTPNGLPAGDDELDRPSDGCDQFLMKDSRGSILDRMRCKLPSIRDIAMPKKQALLRGSHLVGLNSSQSKAGSVIQLSATAVDITVVATSLGDYSMIPLTVTDMKHVGWCVRDADCHDDNICTSDHCEVSSGICKYISTPECDLTLPLQSIRERQTPYVYIGFSRHGPSVALAQNALSANVRKNGKLSSASQVDDFPQDSVSLPFGFDYFGNAIKSISLNPNGLLHLPPRGECTSIYDSIHCVTFSSQSNVISLWASDWDMKSYYPMSDLRYLFEASNGSVTPDTMHILYSNMHGYTSAKPDLHSPGNTFSASIHSDGSIVMSYHSVVPSTALGVSSILGSKLSSSYPTTDGRHTRYHREDIPPSIIRNASEVTYCLLHSIGCVRNSCVEPGSRLEVLWDGLQCAALDVGGVSQLSLECVFGGGLGRSAAVVTQPIIDPLSRRIISHGVLSCEVPTLLMPFGTITMLDISWSINNTEYQVINNYPEGSHSVYAVYSGFQNEIVRSNIIVQYSGSSASGGQSCGCNPLAAFVEAQCDVALVCGGSNVTIDCAGDMFGSAYLDSCGICAGGRSPAIPSARCSKPVDYPVLTMHLFAEVLVIVGVMFLMSFALSSVSYYLRWQLIERGMVGGERFAADPDRELARAQNESMNANQPRGRGLTPFECDALGEVTFSSTLHSSTINDDKLATSPAADTPFPECSICLGEFGEGDRCRKLPDPCGHLFHLACIDKWFQVSTACPMCKRSIRTLLTGEADDGDAASSYRRNDRSSSGGILNFPYPLAIGRGHRQEIDRILELLRRRGVLDEIGIDDDAEDDREANEDQIAVRRSNPSSRARQSQTPNSSNFRRAVLLSVLSNVASGGHEGRRRNRTAASSASAASSENRDIELQEMPVSGQPSGNSQPASSNATSSAYSPLHDDSDHGNVH